MPECFMSLPRILEPEVMDTDSDALDYDTMDHSLVNQVFVRDLLAFEAHLGDVLDLGTGTALIPIELCQQQTECRVLAGDAAIAMLELARYRLEVAGLTHRIQLFHGNARQLEFEDSMFHTVMSNSLLHHVPDPIQPLQEAIRVCQPGGVLFFRDLTRPNSKQELESLVNTYAANANEHQRQLFADSLHAAFTLPEMQLLVTSLGFTAESVQLTSDRHWTWQARKPNA
jgi:ubiquinone/menaquinone biosynthesis C-methylase UbiE